MEGHSVPRDAFHGCLPRTRGDGRHDGGGIPAARRSPPHARGWKGCVGLSRIRRRVSPARAGMEELFVNPVLNAARLPRTRGDGRDWSVIVEWLGQSPPHARGWKGLDERVKGTVAVSPARAGMEGPTGRRARSMQRLPRTRGDGRMRVLDLRPEAPSPPHARGWKYESA